MQYVFFKVFFNLQFDRDQVVQSDLIQMDIPGKVFIVGSSQRWLHYCESICKEAIKASQHSY